jgi:hypothetical protein
MSSPVIGTDGTKMWYQDGKLHRTDGPAVEYTDGGKFWYQNGKPHRTDGPAVEEPDGTKMWYLNDKLHRTAGPAVEDSGGTKEWYQNGIQIPAPSIQSSETETNTPKTIAGRLLMHESGVVGTLTLFGAHSLGCAYNLVEVMGQLRLEPIEPDGSLED